MAFNMTISSCFGSIWLNAIIDFFLPDILLFIIVLYMELINFDTDKVDKRTKHNFLLPDCHYRKRGSASYIVREVLSVRE